MENILDVLDLAVGRDSTSYNRMFSSLTHYYNKATTFFSLQENNRRVGNPLAWFLLLQYDPLIELEPRAPLVYFIVATRCHFSRVGLAAKLDLAFLP